MDSTRSATIQSILPSNSGTNSNSNTGMNFGLIIGIILFIVLILFCYLYWNQIVKWINSGSGSSEGSEGSERGQGKIKILTTPPNTTDTTESVKSDSLKDKMGPGWCYIGTDRGYRTCMNIGEDTKCMSGEIFPSQEICMNPELRP